MTKVQHTLGPWEIDHTRTVFPAGKRGLAIAVAEQHRPEAPANARLIAAAPELLHALRLMLEDYRTDGCQDHKCKICKRSHNAENAARTAIAKATGENEEESK